MAKQREAFMAGALANGVSEKKASKIFELMEYFAGYGFNKSHSTAYALLAYQTAYLKANYPAHFMAALLTIESQTSEKVALYLAECRDLGVTVLPPDVNESRLHFIVQNGAVRFGLGAIKGAGEGAIASVLAARQAVGGRVSKLENWEQLCPELAAARKRAERLAALKRPPRAPAVWWCRHCGVWDWRERVHVQRTRLFGLLSYCEAVPVPEEP